MSYPDNVVEAVWRKGRPIWGRPDSLYREDAYGNVICRLDYGNRNSALGWEIDHIVPNGPDALFNFQPLQWKANVRKRDTSALVDFLSGLG